MTLGETSVLDSGTLTFTIESRILRELGERLVREPEVAIVELVKNAYDADATVCRISYEPGHSISVADDGTGMTLDRFINGWMRIGTSAKEETARSPLHGRRITGEKGIGRFSVRFLGSELRLESVADDPELSRRTRLTAEFDWRRFDLNEDLGKIMVPFERELVGDDIPTGTNLLVTKLRSQVQDLNLQRVRTNSIGVLTPLRSLLRTMPTRTNERDQPRMSRDPGFVLLVGDEGDEGEVDVAASILRCYVLRVVVELHDGRLDLRVFQRGAAEPYFSISDTMESDLESLLADIRFFPKRKGVFTETGIDGRRAYRWIKESSGVAVFDRDFRVHPYGTEGDDWLRLAEDTARNRRDPRSSMALKHFPMMTEVRGDTALNWMLRLPQPAQLVGLVQVEGHRVGAREGGEEQGLVAAADREGFVENEAFAVLTDIVRGAVEAIAYCDRQVQLEQAERVRRALAARIRKETQSAIDEVEASTSISKADKSRIVAAIVQSQSLIERSERNAQERERQLEIMSLLGVVAGFMTHEFGAALNELKQTKHELHQLADTNPEVAEAEESLGKHMKNLSDFVAYSKGYVAGSKVTPTDPYPVRPRIEQITRVFGDYATDRHIEIEVFVEKDLPAPLVPASLYNGIALNLYTNALKSVTAKFGRGDRRVAFRAWNDRFWHHLEVSDTGVGIPVALWTRVFDPLFTTTDSRQDPLGSGMGLGLALVKRGVEAFGGNAEVVAAPPEFATCVRVRLPLNGGGRSVD
jgi:signal transduction histidine kinase